MKFINLERNYYFFFDFQPVTPSQFHRLIYFLAFLGYNWDSDLRESLMDPFRAAVERRAAGTYCGTKYKVLADPLEKSIKNADL